VLEQRRESSLKTQVTSTTLRKLSTSLNTQMLLSHLSLLRERDSRAMSTRQWKEASLYLEVNTSIAQAVPTLMVLKLSHSTMDL